MQVSLKSVTEAIGIGWVLWTLAELGLVVGLWERSSRTSTSFLLLLLVFSALAVCQGLYFRPHYFIMILPAVSLLVGVASSKLSDLLTGRMIVVRFVPILLFAASLSLPILSDKKFFFRVSPVEGCRMIYPESPFPESVRIADYLRENTSRMIQLQGWDPNPRFIFMRSGIPRPDIFTLTA